MGDDLWRFERHYCYIQEAKGHNVTYMAQPPLSPDDIMHPIDSDSRCACLPFASKMAAVTLSSLSVDNPPSALCQLHAAHD